MVDKKNIEDFYPLSPMQQGMLFHSLYSPGSGMYVEQEVYALRGELDVEALEKAWTRVIERHPILRTAFVGEGLKEPVQRVHRKVDFGLRHLDWRKMGPEEREAKLAALYDEERRRGFDLSEPPLFRLTLVRVDDASYQLAWTYHHILLDGWSVPLLLQEVMASYQALSRGEELSLPQRRPYRDYIVWLRQQDRKQAEVFWRRHLQGVTAPTPLPIGLSADHDLESQFDVTVATVDEQITATLKEFARSHQLTLSTVIHGAWALLLSRYSDSTDVVFGTTVSGRPPDLEGSDSMVGLFINTLPVRARIPSNDSVVTWLQDLQQQLAELRQFEYSPLIGIQSFSEVPRGTPLFESAVVFENYPTTGLANGPEAAALEIESLRSVEQANFPLALVTGVADRLVCQVHYDRARFSPAMIEYLLGHLRTALASMAAQPQQRVRRVSLLDAAERARLIEEWSGERASFPVDRCAHQLFEEQAARAPDAPAVAFEDTDVLTYGELNRRANQLAHYLINQCGVEHETLVGIHLDRSPEMIVAVLGVLKSGGAYLPLEPSLPADRLAFVLEETAVPVLLTTGALVAGLPQNGSQVICLDAEQPQIDRESDGDPSTEVTPENLAYVIYTSGSTGRPKGTLLHHRGFCNFLADYCEVAGIDSSFRCLQFFSFGFDGSVADIFSALISGATLHVVSAETVQSFQRLHEVLKEGRITHTIMTPTTLTFLEPDGLRELRSVVSAGETCPAEVVSRWWAPGRKLVNFYGPTEVSVGSLRYEVPAIPGEGGNVPIGRPVPNLRVYLLDGDLEPVPVGVVGEICLGGIGVGRGYLNRPELTAEKFIPDPFGHGSRLYRTGDLARYLPSGDVEFVGRRDHQVKMRGFRIELGEIESVLREQSGIREAIVQVREDEPGDRRLVGYVVPEPGHSAEIESIRDGLRSRLPDYMLPASIVELDQLPVTASGKVDRKALPAPDGTRRDGGQDHVEPRDEVERKLVEIWEEILDVRPIGVKDDFFDLGGHSILAVRMMARIERDLGTRPDMASIFSNRTIEGLAKILRGQGGSPPSSSLVGLETRGSKRPLFFVHPSGGSVHWYEKLSRRLGSKQPFYGLQARGLHGDDEIHTRIEDMASYYIDAIRTVQPQGPYLVGGWSFGVIVAYEMGRQLYEQGDSVERLFILDQGPSMPFEEPEDHAAFLVQLFGVHVSLSVDRLRELDEEEQIAHVLEEAKKVDWIYPEVTLRDFRHFVQMMKTQQEAWRRYEVKPYPGSVTLLRSEEQVGGRSSDPDLGWGPFALEGVEIHKVKGDHLSMMREPHVKTVAKHIKNCLKHSESVV